MRIRLGEPRSLCMKFALCNTSLPDLSFDAQCEAAARMGFHGMMLSPASVSPQKDATRLEPSYGEYLLETAQFHGLTIAGFRNLLNESEGVGKTPLAPGSSDSAVHAATLSYLEHLLGICYAMEGTVMVLGSAKERRVPPHQTVDETANATADLLRKTATLAAPFGITIAVDPIPYHETNFVTSAREAAILQGLIAHPHCRLQLGSVGLQKELDASTPGAPTPEGITPSESQIAHYSRELIHFHRERLCHFHLLAEAGQELLPFALALREIHYKGWIAIEVPPGIAAPSELARETLAQLRKLCGQG